MQLETKKQCKYFSKGFCKHGSSCKYSHLNSDCKNHLEEGKCYKSDCLDRHKEGCRFDKSRKGCDKKETPAVPIFTE